MEASVAEASGEAGAVVVAVTLVEGEGDLVAATSGAAQTRLSSTSSR